MTSKLFPKILWAVTSAVVTLALAACGGSGVGHMRVSSPFTVEDAPLFDADAAAGLEATYLGTSIVDALRLICGRWPVGVVDADFKAPLTSDAPALLLSGEHDPATPPAYASDVMAGGRWVIRNRHHKREEAVLEKFRKVMSKLG